MQDLRDALRAMAGQPLVTGIAVLSLALGIGANAAIFSILDSLLLKTLPVRNPESLIEHEKGPQKHRGAHDEQDREAHLHNVAWLVALGTIAGLLASVWMTRLIESLLVHTRGRDPLTLGSAAVVLTLAAGIAARLPTRPAARIDPAAVQREG